MKKKIKTVEEKKKEKLPKYIKVKGLEEHLNSKEMKDFLKKLEEMEEFKAKTKNVSVSQY